MNTDNVWQLSVTYRTRNIHLLCICTSHCQLKIYRKLASKLSMTLIERFLVHYLVKRKRTTCFASRVIYLYTMRQQKILVPKPNFKKKLNLWHALMYIDVLKACSNLDSWISFSLTEAQHQLKWYWSNTAPNCRLLFM